MAGNVTVRRARTEDICRLAEWNAQLIRDERNDGPARTDELGSRLTEWLAKEYRASVFEVDGAPFGYALYRELPECVHLRHFFVAPGLRRQGLGRRAFEALRRESFPPDKRVIVEVLVWNEAGTAFWKRAGFTARYLGLTMPPA
ncbi:MAG TPA: GNAT family N-acetyltransferase [Casimicrobiaceae bacterium]|nr:GNAT family N-acetyltransferase [Casimicrobiaceae bacterium]